MSVKIIDKRNPIVLLENYRIKGSKTIGKIHNDENVFLCLTHFNTLFKNKSELKDWTTFFQITAASDLIHSTVGLFDICLPDMDLDTIYNSTVDKEAYTILIFSSRHNALERLKSKMSKLKDKTSKAEKIKSVIDKAKYTESLSDDNDKFVAAEACEDDFKLVYDDFQSEEGEQEDEEDEEEEEEDEDFSRGYNSFIRRVYRRKLDNLNKQSSELTEVGFEDQIIGAISFKIRYIDVRRIVHVTLLAVHQSYRSTGLGRHLTNLALSAAIVGHYDAVVVHADFSASAFFQKLGFSDDSLLNTQWHSLEPEYTNCSLLTFVSPYSSGKQHNNELLAEEFSAAEMEVDVKLWQQKAVELHCFQFQVFQRMKMEIGHLKETIKNQDQMMKNIMAQLRDSNKEKIRYERFLKSTMGSDGRNLCEKFAQYSEKGCDKEGTLQSNDDIELKVKTYFNDALRLGGQLTQMQYTSFTSGISTSILQAEFQATRRSIEVFLPKLNHASIGSPRLLFFCEPFSLTQEAKTKITSEGFASCHRKPGSQGNGFYFATNPKRAAIYSATNTIIAADVVLGNICKYIYEIKPQNEAPPKGYNSVLVSTSYCQQSNNSATDITNDHEPDNSDLPGQEYVIFDAAQAMPLGLVSYKILD